MIPAPHLEALAAALTRSDIDVPVLDTLLQVIERVPVMIGLFDTQHRHIYANQTYLAYMKRSLPDLMGSTLTDVLGEDYSRMTASMTKRALQGAVVQTEGWVPNPDGGQSYVIRLHAPHRRPDDTIVGYFVLLQEITEWRKVQDDLVRLAYYDPLTGLANRLLLLKHISDYQAVGEPFALAIVDIDRFSEIRSSLGQTFADDVLSDLAPRLGGASVDLLARVSDHAFALLIAGDCDPASMESKIESIAAVVRAAHSGSGVSVLLSASIGITTWSEAHGEGRESAEEVLRNAEIAAGRAHAQGGARHAWFNPAMYTRVVEQVRLEYDLHRAIERGGELWIAYQPIVEMVTGSLAGFEALMRWNHPERGNIPPGVFIPIAESSGLIVKLGRWILQEACHQVADWQEKRVPGSVPLFMSVNLSTRQLREPDIVDVVSTVLRETGVDPSWIKLELTESGVMEKAEESIRLLKSLRTLGIKLSIDDFGTGYSSLSYLHKLPVDSLKVDRSFVSAMHQSEENRAIVRIIVDLARLLGFDVIAEGIETVADANLLRALACDYGQGYHFAKPLPAAQAEVLVKGNLPWRQESNAE